MAVGPEKPNSWFWVLFVIIAMMFGMTFGAHPTSADSFFTVNVTTDAADANIGDGLCKTAANKCSLRAAIQEANADPDPSIIVIKANIYKIKKIGSGEDAGETGDFDISTMITITGVSPATSIIDANFLDRAFDVHTGGALDLVNLTIRNGFSSEQGGAIAVEEAGAIVTTSNVIFRGNTSEVAGGAVSVVNDGVFSAQNSKFIANLARQGGALYFYDADSSLISDSLFDDNDAEYGGAIATYLTNLMVEDTHFESNNAKCYNTPACDPLLMEGGAFYAGDSNPESGGTIILTGIEIDHNLATGFGGGFSIYNAMLSIETSSFNDNYSTKGGGGGYISQVDAQVVNSSFTDNFVNNPPTSAGGGLYVQDSALTVSASTFSKNLAISGGGLYVSGDAPPRGRINDTLLQHVTIANNGATNGGGVWLEAGSGGLTIIGSILEGNLASGSGMDCGGATITISWTLISNDTDCNFTGTNNILNQSAGLGALSYGITGRTLAHVPMMASPVLVAETSCSIFFDQHYNFMPFGDPCTLGAVSGTTRNLLSNSSFESGISGWKVKSSDGKDKVVNNNTYSGSRAFLFKGVNGKTSNLRQIVTGAILTAIPSGHDVCGSAMFYTKNVSGQSLTIQVLVRYSDGNVDKSVNPVILFGGEYVQGCSGHVMIDLTGGRTINKIMVKITSKSTKGKTFVDNVSVTWFGDSARSVQDVTRAGSQPLGFPAAPDGFRR